MPSFREAIVFTETDTPDDKEPKGTAHYLIHGRAWVMPSEGPLVVKWAFDFSDKDNFIDTEEEKETARDR